MNSLARITSGLLAIFCVTGAASAETLICPNGKVSASATDPALAARVCTASDTALSLFAQCGFDLPGPVEIAVGADTDPNCYGVFHCGEAHIDVLTPDAMAELMPSDSIFAPLPIDRFFDSVVVHELAHALYDDTECPYPNCLATSEYFAYSHQFMSLSAADRALVEAGIDMDRRISRDYVVGILAVMSPDRFARRVWQHFSQREDQCAWLDGILSGAILFDHDYP